MFKRLSLVPTDRLERLLGERELSLLKRMVKSGVESDELSSEQLGGILEVLKGSELLQNQRVRESLFATLGADQLRDMTGRYGKSIHPKLADNALELSLVRWSAGTEFVEEVGKILDIPVELMPAMPYSPPAIEDCKRPVPMPEMHWYQAEAANQVLSAVAAGKRRMLLQMPTGSGKTRTVAEAILWVMCQAQLFPKGGLILWLAHTEELCEQAVDSMKRVWAGSQLTELRIIRMWGSGTVALNVTSGAVVFSTFQKVYSALKSSPVLIDGLAEKAAIVVVDEAHKATARSYKEALEYFAAKGCLLLGMTATPGRSANDSKENTELAEFFGKLLLAPDLGENAVLTLRKRGILASLVRTTLKSGVTVNMSEKESQAAEEDGDLPTSVLEKLATDGGRNDLLLKEIRSHVEKREPCLVFACSVLHARVLAAALRLGLTRAESIDGQMDMRHRALAVDQFRKGECDVLVNFGVLSTGFDAPNLRALIIARPTNSIVLYSQMLGRGLRGPQMGGGATCQLIDVEDNFRRYGGVDEVYNFFDGYWN